MTGHSNFPSFPRPFSEQCLCQQFISLPRFFQFSVENDEACCFSASLYPDQVMVDFCQRMTRLGSFFFLPVVSTRWWYIKWSLWKCAGCLLFGYPIAESLRLCFFQSGIRHPKAPRSEIQYGRMWRCNCCQAHKMQQRSFKTRLVFLVLVFSGQFSIPSIASILAPLCSAAQATKPIHKIQILQNFLANVFG